MTRLPLTATEDRGTGQRSIGLYSFQRTQNFKLLLFLFPLFSLALGFYGLFVWRFFDFLPPPFFFLWGRPPSRFIVRIACRHCAVSQYDLFLLLFTAVVVDVLVKLLSPKQLTSPQNVLLHTVLLEEGGTARRWTKSTVKRQKRSNRCIPTS